MCGLVAIISHKELGLYAKDQDIFSSMLVINSLRGSHSTGIFGVNLREKETEWAKATGSPYSAFSSADFRTVFDRIPVKYRAVVGHGRYATRGGVTAENAHPYEVKDITLVHNGTLENGYCFPEFPKFPVDSQFLAWAIATKGIEEAYKEIDGAIAIIYYDKNTDKIHAIRNKERPLWLIQGADKLLLSSEEATLLWMKNKFPNEKFKEPAWLQEDLLYNFCIGDKAEEPLWDTTKLEGYKKKAKPAYNMMRMGYFDDDNEIEYFKGSPASVVNKPKQNVIELKGGKIRNIKSIMLGANKVSIGERLHVLVDDVVPIFNKKGELVRFVLHGTSEEDVYSNIADFVTSIPGDLYQEDEYYNCDYLGIKVRDIARKEGMEKYTVYCDLETLVYKNGKDLIESGVSMLCGDCHTPVETENRREITVEGTKRMLCLTCSGGYQ